MVVFRGVLALALLLGGSNGDGCVASDQNLAYLRQVVCKSIGSGCDPAWQNVSADGDWPNQAVYMHNLLAALEAPTTCLNSSYALDTVKWLNATEADPARFWWTWLVFQVQYYDMPRKAGDRIESPDTLGRKCWAFAYLRQMWDRASLEATLATAGLDMGNFTAKYDAAIPVTMDLCEKVMANCFVNASYDPSRKGTCSTKIFEFKDLGFQRENLKRSFVVKYPFSDQSVEAQHPHVV